MLGQIVLGLSGAQKTGILVVAGIFVVFAIVSAIVVPSRWPQFPGRSGVAPFVVACGALFAGMMLAVFFLARESEEAEAGDGGTETTGTSETTGPTTTSAGESRRVEVRALDYRFQLTTKTFSEGPYTFVMENDGKDVHNLTISGPEVNNAATETIRGGKTAEVQAALRAGEYELYCSVPGHKEAGMDVKITVR